MVLSILVIIWIMLSIGRSIFFFMWKKLTIANNAYINSLKSLISPNGIRAEIARYGGQIKVQFDSIKQSESAFFLGANVLLFPIHGVNRLIFYHELGHALNAIKKSHRWLLFASKSIFLRRISFAIGTDYKFEKEAWIRSGYYKKASYPTRALKSYRYYQIGILLDFISIIVLVIIILGLIF